MSAKSRTHATVARQRKVQAQADRADRAPKSSKSKAQGATQAGPRKHPKNPLPAQHLKKPGNESDVHPSPEFQATNYEGSGKLQGMTALISGGDSGIGRAVAVLFAREGADVGIVYLSEDDDAKETCRHVEEEGQRCLLLRGDVRDAEFCESAVAEMIDEFGKLSILVNNAAFQSHAKSIEDISDEHFDETLRTNLYGYFNLARAAVPHLKQGDCIINTGSETGLFGNDQLLDYSMTKGGIHAFTQSLSKNLVS